MPRATNSPASRKRRKRVLKKAKGFYGNRSRLYRYAKDAIFKAQTWATRDRKNRKRNFRALWITRISAAARLIELPRQDIPAYLHWHISRAGLEREIFDPAARSDSLTIQLEHIHKALHQVPAASAKIPNP